MRFRRRQTSTRNQKIQPISQVAAMHAEALEQDASAFDYDAVYDEMKGGSDASKKKARVLGGGGSIGSKGNDDTRRYGFFWRSSFPRFSRLVSQQETNQSRQKIERSVEFGKTRRRRGRKQQQHRRPTDSFLFLSFLTLQQKLKSSFFRPRYIESLLAKAEKRKLEEEVARERRLAREREAEAHLYGDKEVFVSAAYKEKLAEREKVLTEAAAADKEEEEREASRAAARKGGGGGHSEAAMRGFYANVLKAGEEGKDEEKRAAAATAAAAGAAASRAPPPPLPRRREEGGEDEGKTEQRTRSPSPAAETKEETKRGDKAALRAAKIEAARERYLERKAARRSGRIGGPSFVVAAAAPAAN